MHESVDIMILINFMDIPPENIDDILKIQNPIEQIVYQVKSIQNEIDMSTW